MKAHFGYIAATVMAATAGASVALAAEATENLRSNALEVSGPDRLEGLPRGAPRGQPLDYQLTYDSKDDSITVYVFRATHPNAALWFERADSVLNIGRKGWQLSDATPIERITAFGAAAPNGLRRAYRAGKDMKSTALAVIQVNDWIVKVRSSSTTLDRDAELARLDRVIAALSVKASPRPAYPLELPAACPGGGRATITEVLAAEAIGKPDPAQTMMAGLLAMANGLDLAGGKGSLAAEPLAYCRAVLEGPMAELGTLYRSKAGDGHWEVVFADSGRSFSGHFLPRVGDDKATGFGMLTLNDFDRSHVLMLTKASPDPGSGSTVAATVLLGRGRLQPVSTAVYDSKTIELSLPKDAK